MVEAVLRGCGARRSRVRPLWRWRRWHPRLGRRTRAAESRVRFLGYSVTGAKLFVWTISAMRAGIAGALYVPQVGIINPSEFSPANWIEIAIWVAIGGRGTLVGALAEAVLVNYAKSYFTVAAPESWLFILGALFVLVTLFLPRASSARSQACACRAPRRPPKARPRAR